MKCFGINHWRDVAIFTLFSFRCPARYQLARNFLPILKIFWQLGWQADALFAPLGGGDFKFRIFTGIACWLFGCWQLVAGSCSTLGCTTWWVLTTILPRLRVLKYYVSVLLFQSINLKMFAKGEQRFGDWEQKLVTETKSLEQKKIKVRQFREKIFGGNFPKPKWENIFSDAGTFINKC